MNELVIILGGEYPTNAPVLTSAHLRALLRQDLEVLRPRRVGGASSDHADPVELAPRPYRQPAFTITLTGKCRRLIINIPPRDGKSLLASVGVARVHSRGDPTAEIVCVSYAQDLAENVPAILRLMNSPWDHDIFETRLINPRSRLGELKTLEGGSRLATSVEGMLTGRGGNIIIVDDPLKPAEAASETQRKSVNDWFDHTVTTRANDKERGAVVIIMQRLHEDDLVAISSSRNSGICLPCQRLPKLTSDMSIAALVRRE